jgi:tetratricopeptide (TPR) repeat protein
VVIGLVVLASIAHATPTQDLARAQTNFRARDWQSAIPLLKSALYPNTSLGRDDAVEAHILLGASEYESGDRESAHDEFKKALEIDPERSITTLTFSEGAVRLFDQTKEDLRARIERDAEKKRLAEAAEKLEAYRKSLVVYETRPYYVNFVPFGAGQFQQHRTGPGLFFAIGEGLTGGASVGLFLYLAGTYGLDAKVPLADGQRVRQLQQLTIGSQVAFFGFYAWGVVDSILHYKPRVQIQGDDTLLPPDLRDLGKKPKKASLRERIHLSPMITPTGVGIGIGLEN